MEWLQAFVVVLLIAHTSCQAQTEDENVLADIPWFVWVVIGVVAVILTFSICCATYFTVYNTRVYCKSSPRRHPPSEVELDEPDYPLNTPHDYVDWELDRKNITLRDQLGIGEFGPIYDAELQLGLNVTSRAVVKVFRQGTSQDLVRFREEVEELKHLQHSRVGRVFGVVSQSPYYLVMELTINGDLKTFLLTAAHRASNHRLSPGQLVALATDVAEGLSYMEARGYVHKDVAARNCIVMQNLSAKITDFKLGRYLHRSEYAVQNDGSLMPLRENTPVLRSFGVLLWEVMGRGGFPYQDLGDGDVVNAVCHTRQPLVQPAECPDTVYQEMLCCWNYTARERPAMDDLHQTLKSSILTNTYSHP